MSHQQQIQMMDFCRRKTLEFLESIAALPECEKILGYRPGPGRAHIAWQIMHLGATDDRHLNVRIGRARPVTPDLVERFGGGSTPDDDIPGVDVIRTYLAERRAALLDYFQALNEAQWPQKPHSEAPWTHEDWLRVLCWHEAHHQGQAHLTYNLYRAAH